MFKYLKNMALATGIVMSCLNVNASHIMGMNITYEHVGGDTFLFKSDYFRYCGGTAFNNGNCTNASTYLSPTFMVYCEDNG